MTDEDSIRNLISRYFHLLDDRNFDEWGKLMAEDISITMNGNERWPPNMQIDDQRGQHISANQVIQVEGDVATAVFDYFYIGYIGPQRFQRLVLLSFGRYAERFVHRDGEWLFQSVAMDTLPPPP